MAKLYKAIDGMDGVVSGFLVHNGMVAVTTWRDSDDAKIATAKALIDDYGYQDIKVFNSRAINPILMAEW